MGIQKLVLDAFDPDSDTGDYQDDGWDSYRQDMDDRPTDVYSDEELVDLAQRLGELP